MVSGVQKRELFLDVNDVKIFQEAVSVMKQLLFNCSEDAKHILF